MIPLLLAQVSPDEISSWLKVIFFLSGGISAMLWAYSLWPGRRDKLRISPQPFLVKADAGVASAEELREVHGRIKRERAELDAAIAELRAEDRRLREKLDAELRDMRESIDVLPQRVINLLRETKGLL